MSGELARRCPTCGSPPGRPCRKVQLRGGLGGPTRTHRARLSARSGPTRSTGPTRRSRPRSGPTSAEKAAWERRRQECLARDGHRCRRCGSDGETGFPRGLQVAHVIPLGNGRSRYLVDRPINQLANLCTLCPSCHAAHDDRHEWTWEEIGITPDESLRAPAV